MKNDHDIAPLLERLTRILHNDAHKEGMKPVQWEVLRYLLRANRFSRSPGAVTTYLGVTKGTVSQTLNTLERKGLIEKKADPVDKRTIHMRVTSAGRKALRHDPAIDLDAAMGQLGGGDKAALSAHLETVLTSMLHNRGGRPFGACKACRHFNQNVPKGKPHYCGLLHEPLSNADGEAICVEHEAAA